MSEPAPVAVIFDGKVTEVIITTIDDPGLAARWPNSTFVQAEEGISQAWTYVNGAFVPPPDTEYVPDQNKVEF